jgi:hypothetical protein
MGEVRAGSVLKGSGIPAWATAAANPAHNSRRTPGWADEIIGKLRANVIVVAMPQPDRFREVFFPH